MKVKTTLQYIAWISFVIAILSWGACFPPTFKVEQPQAADTHSSFVSLVMIDRQTGIEEEQFSRLIEINSQIPFDFITQNITDDLREPYLINFGIKLPRGWTVEDNIVFVGSEMGMISYSHWLASDITRLYPPEHGYYWWVGESLQHVSEYGNISFYPKIFTIDQSGYYYIDYMFGYNGSIGQFWDNDKYIGVGLPDTVWVTSSADNGPGSLREALSFVKDGGHIFFHIPINNTIFLKDQLVIFKDVHIHGIEDSPDHNSSIRR